MVGKTAVGGRGGNDLKEVSLALIDMMLDRRQLVVLMVLSWYKNSMHLLLQIEEIVVLPPTGVMVSLPIHIHNSTCLGQPCEQHSTSKSLLLLLTLTGFFFPTSISTLNGGARLSPSNDILMYLSYPYSPSTS